MSPDILTEARLKAPLLWTWATNDDSAPVMQLVAHGLVAVERRAQKGRAGSEELASVARSPASMRQVNAGVRPAIAALRASAPPAPGSTHR